MKTSRLSFLLLLLWIGGAQSQQQAPVAIGGVVIESATGRPLSRVSLELRPYQPPPPPGVPPPPPLPPTAPVSEARYPGITNDNGQFVFRNVPPGRYTLTASRNGYVHSDYGQRGPNGKAVPLTVAAGQPVTGIQLFITRAAAISGHVYDSKGAPFPYMQMHARRVTYTGGRRTLTITGSTYTDDQGEYRIYGLPPGQYVLSAEGETSNQRIVPVADSLAPPLPGSVVIQGIGGSMLYNPDPANQRKPQQRGQGAGAVYFRAATNDREAWPIELRAGDDLKGTDITYVGAQSVTATFSGLAGLTNVSLQVLPLQTTLAGAFQSGEATVSLPPGSYVVVARAVDSARRPLMAHAAFDASAANPPNVKLSLNPPVPISGRVVLEGQLEGTPTPDLARVSLRLRRIPPVLGSPDSLISLSNRSDYVSGDGGWRIQH
jgi:hypothetical protein